VTISYEHLPEDASFFDEMRGFSRSPLATSDLIRWAVRAVSGQLQPLGQVHVRFGTASALDGTADVPALLRNVQDQHVSLTSVTGLHACALADLLELEVEQVLAALKEAGVWLHHTKLPAARTEAERWALAIQAAALVRGWLPKKWAEWLVEPVHEAALQLDAKAVSLASEPGPALAALTSALSERMHAAEETAHHAAEALRESGAGVCEAHLLQQLLTGSDERDGRLPAPLAAGAARIVAGCYPHASAGAGKTAPPSTPERRYRPLWGPEQPKTKATTQSDEEALDRWGFQDTRFVAQWCDGRPVVKMSSQRYAVGGKPLSQLWALFQREIGVPLVVREELPHSVPMVPAATPGLYESLCAAVPAARVSTDPRARLRCGTGQGLADIWGLRTGTSCRMPDAVVRPESEEEVNRLLAAAMKCGFAIVPVGGRTNVTSATKCPEESVDSRPFVALDMRGMAKVRWVNSEDGVAMVEAGITGSALKEALRKEGVTMGMEPDSMELSTLGGWIATRASGMKRARYGNIEDMVAEVRVVTPSGVLWQHHDVGGNGTATAFGRTSVNVGLPGMILGSEGCLGIIVAAIVRVRPLPAVVEYQSVLFPDWDRGAKWMRDVAKLPAGLRPASCRLMDSKQLALAKAMKEDDSYSWKAAAQSLALRVRGVQYASAAAVTLVFEGESEEVATQKRAVGRLVRLSGGTWGGATNGEAGYSLTFAIAYLRDFALDHQILSESFETFVPWSSINNVWPAVTEAVAAKHKALMLPGRPFMSHRLTQLYDEGGALYMYIATSTVGLEPAKALHAFEQLEAAARRAVLATGGSLSHHHGVGKLRAPLLGEVQSPVLGQALQGLKAAVDPGNVLAAGNGVWAQPPSKDTCGPHQIPCTNLVNSVAASSE
jgi:alkyldihydroxyacetonephosphate synthase